MFFSAAATLLCAMTFAASDADFSTSPVLWEKTDWGEFGVGQFNYAPFPDDSRKDGFTRKGKTYSFEEHYNDPSTSISIPEGFDAAGKIDLIVICHGHINNCRKFVMENRIGNILKDAGRNAILIVPQGPKDVPDSCGGKFEKPGMFAKFVDEVFDTLKREGRVPQSAVIGNVLLGGFSGGGRPVGFIIKDGGLGDKLAEVWLIDAVYEQLDKFCIPFTDPSSGCRPQVLRSLFSDALSDNNALLMAKIGTPHGRSVTVVDDGLMTDIPAELKLRMKQNQILFIHTTLPHDAFKMANRYIGPLIESSAFLRPIPDKKK